MATAKKRNGRASMDELMVAEERAFYKKKRTCCSALRGSLWRFIRVAWSDTDPTMRIWLSGCLKNWEMYHFTFKKLAKSRSFMRCPRLKWRADCASLRHLF